MPTSARLRRQKRRLRYLIKTGQGRFRLDVCTKRTEEGCDFRLSRNKPAFCRKLHIGLCDIWWTTVLIFARNYSMKYTSKTLFGTTNERARGWALRVRNRMRVFPIYLHSILLTGPYRCTKFERNRSCRSYDLVVAPCSCKCANY